ncbi:MAG: cupin domain-containing protein [Alphaproteobacteria bacterium]|nr:cupin domain-containing protein [Alphaproteobacteria bacterium]
MKVVRATARPTKQGPADKFSGTVWQDEVVVGTAPSRMRATIVSFTPGARTAWHTHPVGQVLYCLSGIGRVQRKGEPVQILNPGDTVMIPPEVMHWHGAAPDRLFAHMAMSESTDKGETTSWYELVSEAEYKQPPAAAA